MAQADNQEVKSKRELTAERLRKRYPDREFADDEALFGQIYDDYDDYDKKISDYQNEEKRLSDMFASDPRSTHFLANWANGADPVIELLRQFGPELREKMDDPAEQDAIAEAHKEYLERVAKSKEMEDQYVANSQTTVDTIDTFQQENGLSDEQVDEIVALLDKITNEALVGTITAETLLMAKNALNFDAAVAEAGEEGVIAGRNQKIEERLRKRNSGDGTEPIGGGRTAGDTGAKKPKSIFDIARGAQ